MDIQQRSQQDWLLNLTNRQLVAASDELARRLSVVNRILAMNETRLKALRKKKA